MYLNTKNMKKLLAALLFCLLPVAFASSADSQFLGGVAGVSTAAEHVEIVFERGFARVSSYGEGFLRVRATRGEFENSIDIPLLVEDPRAPELVESEQTLILKTPSLELAVDRKTGKMTISDQTGRVLTQEPEDGGIFFNENGPGCVKMADPADHYYGFGEKTGPLDKRGTRMEMWNTDNFWSLDADPLYQSHPFFMTLREGRAHGLFFANSHRTVFDMAKSRPDRWSMSADDGELDYFVIAGPTPKDVVSRYGELVGRMPLPPLWGLGFHQCRWSYKTAKAIRELRDGFAEHQIPVDAFYLDIHYMDGFRVFTFDEGRFPDPAGLFSELSESGIRTVVIVDPGVKIDPAYETYMEGLENEYFARDRDGGFFTAKVWPGDVYYPDFYREDVRDWWGGKHSFYTDLGVAGIWTDMNEPAGWESGFRIGDLLVNWGSVDWLLMRHGSKTEPVPHARAHNLYASFMAQATYEGLQKLRPGERPFVISRAGFPGIQRHALVWTGDNSATWGHLAMSVPMQLNMGLSGIAWNGSDIGGFGGTPSREMFARWMELGAFYPFCRDHTAISTPDQEPWEFGDEVTEISREYISLRYRLLPYTYTVFEEATRLNWPVMRALLFEFPDDPQAVAAADQFLWGEWIMAAPVLEKGATRRSAYLPAGDWYDFHTGLKWSGPARIEVEAPLETMPLFARAGAIIPMAPDMKHTGEKPWAPLTLLVYPAQTESSFTLYEDDGKSFDYREGKSARTTFTCAPISGGVSITVGKRQGDFVPARKNILFKVFGLAGDEKVSLQDETGTTLTVPGSTFMRDGGAWLIQLPQDKAVRTVTIAK